MCNRVGFIQIIICRLTNALPFWLTGRLLAGVCWCVCVRLCCPILSLTHYYYCHYFTFLLLIIMTKQIFCVTTSVGTCVYNGIVCRNSFFIFSFFHLFCQVISTLFPWCTPAETTKTTAKRQKRKRRRSSEEHMSTRTAINWCHRWVMSTCILHFVCVSYLSISVFDHIM